MKACKITFANSEDRDEMQHIMVKKIFRQNNTIFANHITFDNEYLKCFHERQSFHERQRKTKICVKIRK